MPWYRRSRPTEVRTPTYGYNCCAKSDIEQILSPGQTFNLHWSAELALGDSVPMPRYVTISAELVGPYEDPFSVNSAGGDVRTVTAADVTADTWEAQQVVSSMVLPADLPSGLFQVRLKQSIDSGTTMESMGIVRVGSRSP